MPYELLNTPCLVDFWHLFIGCQKVVFIMFSLVLCLMVSTIASKTCAMCSKNHTRAFLFAPLTETCYNSKKCINDKEVQLITPPPHATLLPYFLTVRTLPYSSLHGILTLLNRLANICIQILYFVAAVYAHS